jgi:hypothetical protein
VLIYSSARKIEHEIKGIECEIKEMKGGIRRER